MKENLFSLEGKVALVTGAAGLLGREHCIALSNAGANVVAVDLSGERISELARSLPTDSIALEMNVTQKDSVESVLGSILARFDHLDILVNNAAINEKFENPEQARVDSQFENFSLEAFDQMLRVNVLGVFLCSQIFGHQMVQQGRGSIINIASTYGVVAPDQSLYIDASGAQSFYKSPAYPTTKSAVIGLTRYLAAYWGKSGVRTNSLSPGGVENAQDSYFVEKYSQKTPVGRMAMPTDFAGGLVYLASDASAYVNGANLMVDGGFTVW